MNGIALHGGYIPFGGTFLTFSDYSRNAIRMAALMKLRSIYVFTHDSIGLGEDGPTHQSVEHIASLRLIPNLMVWRPCDTTESAVAWGCAVQRKNGPSALIFSRQNCPFVSRSSQQIKDIARGGYILRDPKKKIHAVIIATGSEIALALQTADRLGKEGVGVRVVSMPSTTVFDQQDAVYKASVLPAKIPRIAVEAGVSDFWWKYGCAAVHGVDTFGESAPAPVLYEYFGLTVDQIAKTVKHVFAVMPQWSLLPEIIIATAAAVIASQALISGSFTLVSEAISLNFWPKFKVNYPTVIKGQVYIPLVNWFLWIACSLVVVFFGSSERMEAAYGLSITITMIMTTMLLSFWLPSKGAKNIFRIAIVTVFLSVESVFLIANLNKFMHGGWVSILIAMFFFVMMYGWYYGRQIKNRYITFTGLDKYLEQFRDIKNDSSIPYLSANLVYITKSDKAMQIESKIIYSIFRKHPKRANTYFLLHVEDDAAPNTFQYTVHQIIPGTLIKIDFKLGFKIERRINLYFRQVIEDLVAKGEYSLESPFESMRKYHITSNFLFVDLDRVLTVDYKLPAADGFIMNLHNIIRNVSSNDIRALGLDSSSTISEKIPILIPQSAKHRIQSEEVNFPDIE
ncbi:MAG: KUP/HAK/KT family potassium transporter [Paludibacter sp.]